MAMWVQPQGEKQCGFSWNFVLYYRSQAEGPGARGWRGHGGPDPRWPSVPAEEAGLCPEGVEGRFCWYVLISFIIFVSAFSLCILRCFIQSGLAQRVFRLVKLHDWLCLRNTALLVCGGQIGKGNCGGWEIREKAGQTWAMAEGEGMRKRKEHLGWTLIVASSSWELI